MIYFLKWFGISTVAILAQVRDTAFWLKVEYFVLPKMAECIPLDYPVGCPNCRRILSVCTSTKFDKDFICSICLDETSEQPVVAECGHVFCFVCINGYAKHKNKNKGRPTVNDISTVEMIGYLKKCYIASKILVDLYFQNMVTMEYFDLAFSASNVARIMQIIHELEERMLPQFGIAIADLEDFIVAAYNEATSFDSFDTIDIAEFIASNASMVIYVTDKYRHMFNCLENNEEFVESTVYLQQAANKLRQFIRHYGGPPILE